LDAQTGNPQPRTWHEPDVAKGASLNSEGLPNSGIDYYLDSQTIADSMAADPSKPYMVSISGKTLADNIAMLKKIVNHTSRIAAIELNLACPNVIGKPIIAYDFEQLKNVLAEVTKVPGISKIPLGIKMPPYFDGVQFQLAAGIINAYSSSIGYVACINTIGNALAIDIVSEAPVIASNNGYAGLSGHAVKYTALANVRQMRTLLDDSIDVVGVGGVESGVDAFEMILCGANAVQVGTCHWKEGPKCFDRICMELREIMKNKGYSNIEEFRGKLQPWTKDGAKISRKARKSAEKATEAMGAATAGTKVGAVDAYMILSAVLAVGIGVLLADKFGFVELVV
jgi:dihydroorotate dehydrogenase (fumarate)